MFKIQSGIKYVLGLGTIALATSCAVTKNYQKPNNIIALEQAEYDSLFFRTLFNKTEAAKNSEAVADFNRIAANTKNITKINRNDLSREIIKNAEANGINKHQKNIINGVQYITTQFAIQMKQQLADIFAYEELFKKYGIDDKLK